jgi:hypothetical protein
MQSIVIDARFFLPVDDEPDGVLVGLDPCCGIAGGILRRARAKQRGNEAQQHK